MRKEKQLTERMASLPFPPPFSCRLCLAIVVRILPEGCIKGFSIVERSKIKVSWLCISKIWKFNAKRKTTYATNGVSSFSSSFFLSSLSCDCRSYSSSFLFSSALYCDCRSSVLFSSSFSSDLSDWVFSDSAEKQ